MRGNPRGNIAKPSRCAGAAIVGDPTARRRAAGRPLRRAVSRPGEALADQRDGVVIASSTDTTRSCRGAARAGKGGVFCEQRSTPRPRRAEACVAVVSRRVGVPVRSGFNPLRTRVSRLPSANSATRHRSPRIATIPSPRSAAPIEYVAPLGGLFHRHDDPRFRLRGGYERARSKYCAAAGAMLIDRRDRRRGESDRRP